MTEADRTTAPDTVAEVLIIGAGASGAVAAARLAQAGFDVVCLEQGGFTDPREFPGDKLEWELLAPKNWHPNPNVRGRAADYPCDTSDSDVNPLMWSGVGGSTILWAAHWLRFLPSDFRARTLDGIADDWPFTYDDLLPFYRQVEQEFAVSGLGGDPAYPDGAAMPLPPLPIGKMGRKAAEGLDALGWHWWPGPNAIASRDHGNLRPGRHSSPGPGYARSPWTVRAVPPGRSTWTGRAVSTGRTRRSSSSARTGSAPPGCCCCRRPRASRTAWRTPPGWSASG
jgi:choline dehydrogenase-like flavoprotein